MSKKISWIRIDHEDLLKVKTIMTFETEAQEEAAFRAAERITPDSVAKREDKRAERRIMLQVLDVDSEHPKLPTLFYNGVYRKFETVFNGYEEAAKALGISQPDLYNRFAVAMKKDKNAELTVKGVTLSRSNSGID